MLSPIEPLPDEHADPAAIVTLFTARGYIECKEQKQLSKSTSNGKSKVDLRIKKSALLISKSVFFVFNPQQMGASKEEILFVLVDQP